MTSPFAGASGSEKITGKPGVAAKRYALPKKDAPHRKGPRESKIDLPQIQRAAFKRIRGKGPTGPGKGQMNDSSISTPGTVDHAGRDIMNAQLRRQRNQNTAKKLGMK